MSPMATHCKIVTEAAAPLGVSHDVCAAPESSHDPFLRLSHHQVEQDATVSHWRLSSLKCVVLEGGAHSTFLQTEPDLQLVNQRRLLVHRTGALGPSIPTVVQPGQTLLGCQGDAGAGAAVEAFLLGGALVPRAASFLAAPPPQHG